MMKKKEFEKSLVLLFSFPVHINCNYLLNLFTVFMLLDDWIQTRALNSHISQALKKGIRIHYPNYLYIPA